MEMVRDVLLNRGIVESEVIKVNFELLEFYSIRTAKKLNDYIHAQTQDQSRKTYVLLDEIQNCKEWELVVASLLAEGNYDIYITGSNASMLSGDLATHIAGRYIEIEVYPLNFSEYCQFALELKWEDISIDERFFEYLRYGGFPGLTNAINKDEAKVQYLNGIRNTVVLRDAIQRHQIRDAVLLENVLLYVFDNVGQIFSAKKVSDYLKNLGYKSSVDSVATYINALEDSKIIYPARRYDIKGKKVMQRLEKYYICDLGLRYAQQGYKDNDIAQILENVVFMELKSRGYKVFVGKEKDKEVNFIAEKFDERQYYQVTYLLATEEVMEREYRALKSIKDAYPKTVLSMDRIPIGVDDGIRHKNLVDFLLGK